MSGQNNDAENTIHQWTARVDLTRRDLQTGTVQLPGRLQDLPEPGALEAVDPESEAGYLLELHEPRTLHGLSAFFADQDLKPNDSLTLSVNGNRLTLQVIKRQRRRTQSRPLETAAAEPPEPQQLSAADEETVEDPEVQPEVAAPPPEQMEVEPVESPEPSALAEDAEATVAEAAPETEVAQSTPTPDPFSDFARADGLDPFDDIDELEELDIQESTSLLNQPDATAAETEPARESTYETTRPAVQPTEAPPAPPEAEATDTAAAVGPQPAEHSDQPPAAQHNAGLASFHTLPRRQFRIQAAPEPATPEQSFGTPGGPSSTSDLASQPEFVPEVSGVDESGGPRLAAEQLEAYLAAPVVPAIIQVTKLATELHLDPAELADAVRAKAAEPESRLSNIRPDYYLYRRPTE